MRISPVACLYFLLLGSTAFAQLSRRDLEDIERHRGESREMSVVVETWDFLDVRAGKCLSWSRPGISWMSMRMR